MKDLTITVSHSISIQADPKVVWKYTQDFSNRKSWDKSILDLKIIQLKPFKLIRLKTVGGIITNLKYKLCKKYELTTLKMEKTKSLILQGGGGSWKYESDKHGTRWSQTNSLTFKNKLYYFLFNKILEQQLFKNTLASMRTAKAQIEKL